jgi:hypothetical protein
MGSNASTRIFSGLDLGPGTYYIVIAADAGAEIGWNATASAVVTTATGVTLNSGYTCFNSSAISYPPDGGSCQPTTGLLFNVSSYATPEPKTAVLISLAVCGLICRWRRRNANLVI